jgi:hypothetical protein
MRYFLFISLAICLSACSKPYQDLVLAKNQAPVTASQIRPNLDKTLYRCEVNGRFLFKKFHLSGLLFFKTLPDASTRVVFQNEMGLSYFDFGWNDRDSFQVNKIIDQMNKPALIRTLKKDFEMILAKNLDWKSQTLFTDKKGNQVWRLHQGAGFVYYFFDPQTTHLLTMEYTGKKKKITFFQFEPPVPLTRMPAQIRIRHLRAHFTIELKKLEQDENP